MQEHRKLTTSAKEPLRDPFGDGSTPHSRRRLSLDYRYARCEDAAETLNAATTVFSPDLLVFRLEPLQAPCRQLSLVATLNLAGRWREAILSHSNGLSEHVRAVLSGHNAGGGPADVWSFNCSLSRSVVPASASFG